MTDTDAPLPADLAPPPPPELAPLPPELVPPELTPPPPGDLAEPLADPDSIDPPNPIPPAPAPDEEAHGEPVGDQSPPGENLATLINQVSADLRGFSSRFDFYEDLVRQLQARVETLQTDQIQQLLLPVFQRLAILVTQSADSAALALDHGEGYQANVEFDYFHDAVVETLDLRGVAPVEAAIGDTFDRALHASRKSVPTDDHTKDWTLAKVMRQGLIRPGAERAFIPAQVSVFRYDPSILAAPERTTPPTFGEFAVFADAPTPNLEPNQGPIQEGDLS